MNRTIFRQWAAIPIFVLLLFASACNEQSQHAAPASALPAMGIPVGPVPGPKLAENLPKDPYIDDDVALQEGWRLFNWYNCSGCHGGHAGGGMGPSLRDPVWLYGSTDGQIFASIAEGRGKGMPAWGTKIPEQQIWKLVAYIKSLNTPQEPDAPKVPPQPEVKETKG